MGLHFPLVPLRVESCCQVCLRKKKGETMNKLPSEIEEYFKTGKPIDVHIVRAFISGYFKGVLGEKEGSHTHLTDDEVAVLGLEKAKAFLNFLKERHQLVDNSRVFSSFLKAKKVKK